jgi:hypothetical protein
LIWINAQGPATGNTRPNVGGWRTEAERRFCHARGMMMDLESSDIGVGAIMVALAVVGLVLGARAVDIEMEIFGFSLATFAVVFVFNQIRRHHDDADAARGEGGDHV